MEFDETKAIEFIRAKVGDEISAAYTDDQLLNVIDIIFDFYEQNGLLEVDFDDDTDDDEVSIDDLLEYARRMLRKDLQAGIDPQHLQPIVQAEIEYEQMINDSLPL